MTQNNFVDVKKHQLGQHNFKLRSVPKIHESGSEAEFISYTQKHQLGQNNNKFSPATKLNESGSEAGFISFSHIRNLPYFFIMRLHSIHISLFMCA